MPQLCLMLLSFAGYFLLMYILFHGRKTALYPAMLVSGIVAASFLAGLADCLQMVYGYLYINGFVLLPVCMVYLIRSRSGISRPEVRSLFPFVVLIAGAFMLYAAYEGLFLYAFDDFSHWGKVAGAITENMRLPISADQLKHGTYPPGSALFLAYVSSIMGSSDGVWLFAQAFMMLSFWISLLAASKKFSVQILLALLISGFMRFVTSPASLYVDTLLASAAFACIMLCLALQRNPADSLLPLAITLCAVVMIKNSGVFLALMIAAYAVFLSRRQHRAFSPRLLVLLLPFLLLFAWNIYCGVHLAQATSHQMSLEHYQAVLGDKSAADLLTTLRMILPLILDPRRNLALALIPGYLLVLLALRKQGTLREHRHIFVFAAVLLVVYELGMLLMYLFSMPMEDLLLHQGDDYERYNSTIAAVLTALLLALVCRVRIPAPKRDKAQITQSLAVALPSFATLVLVGVLLTVSFQPLQDREYRINRSPTAYYFSLLKEELAALPDDASCVVLHVEADNGGYHHYISRYYLHTDDVQACYTRAEALALLAAEPDRYYIDLLAGEVYAPGEAPPAPILACTNVLDSVGYQQNTRYSSTSASDVEAFYWDITGYIPIRIGDVIRLENVTWYPTEENLSRGGVYWFREGERYRDSIRPKSKEELLDWNPVYDENGSIIQITVPPQVGTTTVALRIICQDINSSSIITVNEEIR